jgi:hypothetical protein
LEEKEDSSLDPSDSYLSSGGDNFSLKLLKTYRLLTCTGLWQKRLNDDDDDFTAIRACSKI